MAYTTLIEPFTLADHLDHPDWVVVDCRFSLANPNRGRSDYLQAHIPGAAYAHLDEDLCGPVTPGRTGRHPLPPVEHLAARFSSWGIGANVQVVAYDDWPGASGAVAARLWWSLRWLGHTAVCVLDGGWEAWLQESRPIRSGSETRPPRSFSPRLRPELLASTSQVDGMRLDPGKRVFDSRALERYHGLNETIDPVAGHIPGARPAPFIENIGPDGRFLPAGALRTRFIQLLAGVPAENSAFYCGSGVTAAHNLLALAHAGLGDGQLYAGSWSEWITDPSRPVATSER